MESHRKEFTLGKTKLWLKQIWKTKGKLSDNSLNKTKQVWKATGKLFANVGYQWRSTGKKVALGKLNCGYQWRPTGNKFALGELCPLTKLSVQCCSKLDLEEWMAPVHNSSGPEPKMMFGQNSSSLGLHCQKTFKQISSNLVSQMSQRRLLASLQAIKEKKGVRFSALYLQQKRNLLVLDHSHQQVSYFFHARSVVKWINVDQLIRKGNLLLDLQKLQKNPIFRISVDIRQNTNFVRAFTTSANVPSIYIQLFWNTLTHDVKTGVYSFQVNEHWLTLSADLLRKALNVTPADSAHPFESPPAGKTDITFTRRRVPSNWLMKMKFNRLLNLIWMIMSTIYNKTTRKLPVVEVKGKGSATDRWIIASQDETTGPSVHPEDATSTKMVRETLSHADAESGGNSEKINSETDTEILNVGSNSKQSHVALAGPNPEHMQDVFLATNYPKVHESLKHTTKEHVHLENPPSSSRTLSSMKNLEDFIEWEADDENCYERSHKGVKASANSDIIFFFTSAQDGNKLLDDERLSLADDRSLQKDDDDEISNLVDLHMGMLGGGWKWQDLQSLLWQNYGTVARFHRFHCRMEPASVPEGNWPTVTKSGF
ncbi:hypothetical protein Tco_1540840 [Tanacetum coccineum]